MQLNTIKGWLFIALFLFLCIPMVQQRFHIVKSRPPLSGAVTATANPKFGWKGWWDGSYQEQKNNYLNDSMGFRPDVVRVNNEIDFLAFRKLHANGVVIGKDHYLYEKAYIEAWCGKDYHGTGHIREQLVKIRMIQDTLQKLGKTFIMGLAPSKARYYPEFFPKDMECTGNDNTNYDDLLRLSDSLHVRYINFNGWFASMRPAAKHLLFSKLGTHWTIYGATLAADSLMKFVSRERHIKGPVVQIKNTRETFMPENTDDDLQKGLNLLLPVAIQKYTYPEVVYDTAGKTRPKAIYIGDSFLWTFMYLDLPKNANSYFEFWYYTNEVWTQDVFDGKAPLKSLPETDWQHALAETDYVLMLHTEGNGHGIESPFVQKAYEHYFGKAQ